MNIEKMREGLKLMLEALDGDLSDSAVKSETTPLGTPYWLDMARKYEGLDEDDNHMELQALLGCDPEMTPWCAAFANAVLKEAGLPGTESLRARDFAEYGEQCDCKNGAIAVFKKHVGFVVKDGEKLLGGNQGNMVKESNLQWYHDNMEFLGYRWPTV